MWPALNIKRINLGLGLFFPGELVAMQCSLKLGIKVRAKATPAVGESAPAEGRRSVARGANLAVVEALDALLNIVRHLAGPRARQLCLQPKVEAQHAGKGGILKRLHLVPFAAVEYAVDSVHRKWPAHKGAAEQRGIAGQVDFEPCSKQPCHIKICAAGMLRPEVGVGHHHH